MSKNAKTKRRPIFWVIGLVVLLGLGGAIAVIYGRSNAAATNATTTEPTATAVTAFIGDLSASATASGHVSSARTASLSANTPARVQDIFVRVGSEVKAGDQLLQLDTSDLALGVASAEQNLRLKEASLANLQAPPAEADVASAQASVDSAQANLDKLLAGPTELELATYEANLRSAQASLWSASANLASARDGVSQAQITAAQGALMAAQLNQKNAQETNADNPTQQTDEALRSANQAVADAQAKLDDLLAGPDTSSAQSNVASAAARVDGNQADYNIQAAGSSEAQIASAQAQLAQAQSSLADLVEGASEADLAAAQAEVTQAEIDLANAQDSLANATLTAPFDGVITAVNVNPGELASGVVLEIADNKNLEIVLQVDEVDIGQLKIGQPATINLETWPDVGIAGEITAIAPVAQTSSSSLVTYEVHLSIGETDLPVRVGMSADAHLITAQKSGVLLVANAAIHVDRQTSTYTVNRQTTDDKGVVTTEEITITVGLRDSQYTQVLTGLNEGDELVVTSSVPSIQFGGPGGGD